MKEITLNKVGNTVETVVISEIFVKVDEKIEAGQVLFEYETDKTSIEFTSETEGVVKDILISEGDEIEPPIVVITLR